MATDAPITGAPSRAPLTFHAAFDAYTAARARFNALSPDLETNDPDTHKREEDAYLAAYEALADTKPELLTDLLQWAEIVLDDIGPRHVQLLGHMRRAFAEHPAMRAIDLYGLDQSMQRVDYIASTVGIVSDRSDLPAAVQDALRGAQVFLNEACETIDGILQPHRLAMGVGV